MERLSLVAAAFVLAACSAEESADSVPGEDQAQDAAQSATAQSMTAQEAAPTIGGAVQALNSGDAAGAISMLESVLHGDPDNATAKFLMGRALVANEQAEDAWPYLLAARDSGRVNTTNIGASPQGPVLADDPRYAALFPNPEDYADTFVEPVEILYDWAGEGAFHMHGWVARNMGDMDGDGVDDAVSTAPGYGATMPTMGAGKVYAYSGATGALLWEVVGEGEGDALGYSVAYAGDVNGDNLNDVLAGAPFGDYTLILSGADGSVLQTLRGNSPESENGESLGISVASPGDMSGDGVPDMLVGAPANGEAAAGAGAVYLFSGATGEILQKRLGSVESAAFGSTVAAGGGVMVAGAPGLEGGGQGFAYRDLSADPMFTIDPVEGAIALGSMFSSVIGDLNNDGVADIYMSDFADRSDKPGAGRIYTISGADGSVLLSLTGETAGEGFGIGPADVGDVNGDGHDDLLVGSWQYAAHAPSGGRVYVISGQTGDTLRTITSKVMGETFGFDATGLGDVNGDGYIDYLLTSAYSAINGARAGRTLVISGAPASE